MGDAGAAFLSSRRCFLDAGGDDAGDLRAHIAGINSKLQAPASSLCCGAHHVSRQAVMMCARVLGVSVSGAAQNEMKVNIFHFAGSTYYGMF